ncbi:MAG: M20/M25/M40 family metallo-hydrolase [Patescibacteria group bacterium]|jgi:acetylornithine deacetylase/succinyl-diaminopimelate desuccinylase-like protein
MDSLTLLEQLVRIPSDKNAQNTTGRMEYEVVSFLRDYFKKNVPKLIVEEQKIEEGRANLLVHDNSPISLLFLCHIDTVEEGKGWTASPSGELKGTRFYGRGSLDMKCGAVAVVRAVEQAVKLGKPGVGALFYCDEEYDSLGIKKFVQEYGGKLNPKLIICMEPTGGKLRRGCRGIVELRYVLSGKTGHAARPSSGISAFKGLNQSVNALQDVLKDYSDPYLGHPTLNIATVRCGALQYHRPDGFTVFGSAGNIIPDYCEVILEVRTVPGLDGTKIKEIFQNGLRGTGVIVESVETKMELGNFVTPAEQLKLVEDIFYEMVGGDMYQDIELGGYTDAQVLAELWKTPVAIWGAKGENQHGADEYVDLPSFEKLEKSLEKVVEKWA